MTEHFANQALATLSAELANEATTLTVASAIRFPTEGNFRILIDSELMMVTAVEGTTFTVERGIEGTADLPHASGSTVTQVLTAGALADKADLDEGVLRASEIPSSVVLATQLPAIYASRYGVSASNTGEENSEALANAIVAAEEQSIGRIMLPNGVIALESGFLLNKSDDEDGTFQYIFEGEGHGTTLELDGELDWLFRLNCTEADEAVHATGNLIGRLQLRDLFVKGVKGAETGLVRTIAASVQTSNVRGKDLGRGVYHLSGYADVFTFDRLYWEAPGEASWFFERAAGVSGDGVAFRACEFPPVARAAKLLSVHGGVVDACVGGIWEVRYSTGVEFRECHLESKVSGVETPAALLKIVNSRIKVSGGLWEAPSSHPTIEIDDDEPLYYSTSLILDGTNFSWEVGDPEVSPPREAHLHIAEASGRASIHSENARAFTTNRGSGLFDPVGIVVTSDVEAIQSAIDAAPELFNSSSSLLKESDAWRVRPTGVRTARRWVEPPYIEYTTAETGIGGTLPKATKRFYRIAVWDGFQWSEVSAAESGETSKDDSAIILALSSRSPNVKLRMWRGTDEGVEDAYCNITLSVVETRLVDTGGYLSGLPWIEESVPHIEDYEKNAQCNMTEPVPGQRVGFAVEKPTQGTWNKGDIIWKSNAYYGSPIGWVCEEAGTPGTWRPIETVGE